MKIGHQVLLLISAAVLWACGSGDRTGNATPDTQSSEVSSAPEIAVSVDPRIELLTAVQQFNEMYQNYGLITRHEFPYKQEVHDHFERLADHEAVQRFNAMAKKGFSFDAPVTAILHCSNPPALEEIVPFSDYVLSRSGGRDTLELFLDALRRFARDSRFDSFFTAHQGFYDSTLTTVKSFVVGENYARMLEDYYGKRQHGYSMILSPLLHDGGYGPRIPHADGSYEVYQLSGPSHVVDSSMPGYWDARAARHTALHEFGHSFVNPLTDRFGDRIDSLSELFGPIAQQMEKKAYGNWRTCVNEHLVRAVTTRFAFIHDGAERGKAVLASEEQSGFVYIRPLVEALSNYESQRTKYPHFEDFYPELVNALASTKPSSSPVSSEH